MNPQLATQVLDAVYASPLCVDGTLTLTVGGVVQVRIKPDNGDGVLTVVDTGISAKSLAFKVQVSACPNRPINAILAYSDPLDTRRFKVTSASRKDNARLEWSCVAVSVKL